MLIIGLNGKAGAGKDTSCGFIKEWGEQHGFEVKRAAFADRLKLSAARIFFPEIDLEDAVAWCNEIKEFGTMTTITESDVHRRAESITGREFLQRYGTEAHRRVFGETFWIDAVFQDSSPDVLVITDVRFQNEAEAIRARDGEVWEIFRGAHTLALDHSSEKPLPAELIDELIMSLGSLERLRGAIFNLMDHPRVSARLGALSRS